MFSFKEHKTQMAIGLWSRTTASTVMSQTFLDENDLLKTILDFESVEAARKHRISSIGDERDGAESHRKTLRQSGTSAFQLSKYDAFTSSGSIESTVKKENVSIHACFKCNKTGDSAKNFPDFSEVVTIVIKPGTSDYSRDFNKPKRLTKAETKTVYNKSVSGSAKYNKIVRIGYVDELKAVIDPGSTDCLIKASIVLENNFNFTRMPNVIFLINFLEVLYTTYSIINKSFYLIKGHQDREA